MSTEQEKKNSPAKYFTDAAVADSELSGYIARPDTGLGELHNPGPDYVRQWPTVNEDSAKLVYPSVT